MNNKDICAESTLLNAVINRNFNAAKSLIHDGADVNEFTSTGSTFLQIVSYKGDYEFAKLLIDNGANVNLYTKDNQESALTLATSAGFTKIVKLLIENGADINHKKADGDSAIDIAKKFGHNDITIVFGQEIDPQLFGENDDLMMDGIASIKRDNSVRMLRSMKRQTLTNEEISKPLEIISVGILGSDLIHKDWGNKNLQSIKTNIGYFVDFPYEEEIINPVTGNSFPLGTNWMQYIGTTFSKDMPIIYMTFMGFIFLRVFNNELHNFKPRSLHKQEAGKKPIVIKEPFDYSYDDTLLYEQLFFFSKQKNEIDAIKGIKDLLDKNVDINKQDNLGQTALMSACEIGNIKITAFLLNNDAEVDIQDKEGFTALMLASGNGCFDIVRQLIESHANVNLKNHRGHDAILFAVKNMHDDVIELLLSSGANIEIHGSIKIDEEAYALEFFTKLDKSINSKEEAIEFLIYALNVNSEQELDLDKFILDMGSFFNVFFQPGRDEKFSSNIVQLHKDMIYKHLQPLEIVDSIKNTIRCRILDLMMDKYSLGKYENSKFENVLNNDGNDSYEYSIKVQQEKYNIKIDIYTNSLILHTIDPDKNKSSFSYKKEGKKYFNKTRGTILIIDNKVIEQDLNGGQRISSYVKLEDGFDINNKKQLHNPKRLLEILKLFTQDNPIKYSAHSWSYGQNSGQFNSYSDYMEKLQMKFSEIDSELKILSPNLHEKIKKFLFDDSLGDANTWGIYNIDFGWASSELKEWCETKNEPFKYTLPSKYHREIDDKSIRTFEDVADILKNEVEIRSEDDKLLNLFLELEEDIFLDDFFIEYENCTGKDFYTDVEQFRLGVSKIFEIMYKKKKYPDIKIEVIKSKENNYLDIKIIQIGSTSERESQDMIEQVENGDFWLIYDYFHPLCDWSIESEFSDGSFRINYLSIDSTTSKPINIDYKPQGFTHILRFYQ